MMDWTLALGCAEFDVHECRIASQRALDGAGYLVLASYKDLKVGDLASDKCTESVCVVIGMSNEAEWREQLIHAGQPPDYCLYGRDRFYRVIAE